MNKAATTIGNSTVPPDSSKVCGVESQSQPSVSFASVHEVEGEAVRVFSGAITTAPVVLSMHGLATSSFMFCELIPRPADGRMQTACKNELAAEPQSGDRTWLYGAISALTKNWPEYLIEAACLGLFMVSACSFTVLLQHPASAIRQMQIGRASCRERVCLYV